MLKSVDGTTRMRSLFGLFQRSFPVSRKVCAAGSIYRERFAASLVQGDSVFRLLHGRYGCPQCQQL